MACLLFHSYMVAAVPSGITGLKARRKEEKVKKKRVILAESPSFFRSPTQQAFVFLSLTKIVSHGFLYLEDARKKGIVYGGQKSKTGISVTATNKWSQDLIYIYFPSLLTLMLYE